MENSLDNFQIYFKIEANPELRIIGFGPECEVYGIDPKEVINKSFLDLVHEDDREAILKTQKAYKEYQVDIFDTFFRIQTPKFGLRKMQAIAQVVRDLKGNSLYYEGYIKDLTLRKSREETNVSTMNYLKNLAVQYQNVVDNVAIVAVTDKKGNIVHVNDLFMEISGYSRDELIGKNHRILKSGLHDKEFYQDLWKTIQDKKVWKGEICNKRKDGTLYWVFTTIAPILGPTGEVDKFLSIRYDITHEKLLHDEEVEKMTQQFMTEKLATVGEVTASIAHEINNPLTIIKAQAEKLLRRNDNLSEDIIKCAESISKTANRIQKIIESIRTLSRNTENDDLEWFPLHEVIEQSVEILKHKMIKNNVSFSQMHIPKNYCIYCYPGEITQVFTNLISNAFDAVAELPERWVDIRFIEYDDEIEVLVIDAGHGIPQEIAQKIMRPFFTTKKFGYGTGLGLSFSKKILKRHNTTLVYDESAKNTTFKIKLKLKKDKYLKAM